MRKEGACESSCRGESRVLHRRYTIQGNNDSALSYWAYWFFPFRFAWSRELCSVLSLFLGCLICKRKQVWNMRQVSYRDRESIWPFSSFETVENISLRIGVVMVVPRNIWPQIFFPRLQVSEWGNTQGDGRFIAFFCPSVVQDCPWCCPEYDWCGDCVVQGSKGYCSQRLWKLLTEGQTIVPVWYLHLMKNR